MNGKALMVVLTVLGLAFGLFGGAVTTSWSFDDRIEAKIDKALDRAIAPLREDIQEMKMLILKRW